jgi:hypothetical protein
LLLSASGFIYRQEQESEPAIENKRYMPGGAGADGDGWVRACRGSTVIEREREKTGEGDGERGASERGGERKFSEKSVLYEPRMASLLTKFLGVFRLSRDKG